MPSQKKIDLKDEYSQLLKENPDFILTRYQGLSVAKLSELRKELHKSNSPFRVVKNNIFKLAIGDREDLKDFPSDNELTGPIGVAFIREEVPAVAKVLKKFSQENDAFKLLSGVMESTYYNEAGIKSLAEMPTRDEALTMIASMMNQVMSSLARGIKAIGEKNG
jgi:large subunit ribosomal protein L10